MRMCDLGDIAALDDKDIQGTTGVDVLPQVESREIIDIGRDVLNRGSPDPTITASVALKVDNYSLMAVAYTDTRNVRHFRVEIVSCHKSSVKYLSARLFFSLVSHLQSYDSADCQQWFRRTVCFLSSEVTAMAERTRLCSSCH